MVVTMHRWLTAERRAARLYALAGLIGFGFAWYLLGWEGIHGTSEYWNTTHNDSVQSIAALRYYLNEPWSWPPLDITSYGYPEGTNLVFADSIPVLALIAKLAGGFLPDGFHYFGYWMAGCFVLQGIAMTALLIVVGQRSYLAMAAAVIMGLLQSALLTRFFHAALMGHFLIIAALALGLWAAQAAAPSSRMRWFWGLIALAFFVHPYLYAMVTVLAVAFALQGIAARKITLRDGAVWLSVVVVGSVVAIVSTGTGAAAVAQTRTYLVYSMNLLAPLVEGVDATGGQYEGFSYLGLGVIALLAVGAVAARSQIVGLVRTRWILGAAVVLMAIYSLSPWIYAGEQQIVELPILAPIEWLALRFRAVGRFVWPLVYVLVATAIVITLRRFRAAALIGLVGAALVVQILDMGPTARVTYDVLRGSEAQYLQAEVWDSLIEEHALVRMSPHSCVVGTGARSFASRELQRISAQRNVPVTTAAVARRAEDCDDPTLRQPLVDGELRVVWRGLAGVTDPSADCLDFELGTVCSLGGLGEISAAQLVGPALAAASG